MNNFFFALLTFVWSSSAMSQSTQLQIGSVNLLLGTDQVSVMKELDSRFHVVAVTGQPETFFL